MKLIIKSTTLQTEINGVPARIWEGKTDSGIPIHCYITRVAVANEQNCTQFERELKECKAPSEMIRAAIPLRMIV